MKDLLLPLFLPFNFVKGILNSALVMILYKPISIALKHAKLGGASSNTAKLNKNSIYVVIFAIIVVALCFAFIFVGLDGAFALDA